MMYVNKRCPWDWSKRDDVLINCETRLHQLEINSLYLIAFNDYINPGSSFTYAYMCVIIVYYIKVPLDDSRHQVDVYFSHPYLNINDKLMLQ